MELFNLWLLLFAVVIFALRAYYIPKRIPGIPYNKLSYIFPWGDLASLGVSYFARGEVFRWFSSQSHTHRSGIFQVFLPSFSTTSPVVVITDQKEVKDIVTRQIGVIDRSGLMHLWFGLLAPKASIGMHTDQSFKAIRWAWNSVLNPVFLANLAGPRTRDSAMALVELWSLKAERGGGAAFEAGADLRRATLEAMLDILLGRQLGVIEAEIAFEKSLKTRSKKTWWPRREYSGTPDYPRFYHDFRLCMVCMDWVTTGVSALRYLWFFRRIFWPFQSAKAYVENCLQRVIQDARQKSRVNEKTGQFPASALEFVMAKGASRPQTEDAMSDDGLLSELLELLVAGHESTASSIGWALKHLADYQVVQETLYQHLVASLPSSSGTLPTSEEILTTSIHYLDAFIAETLRFSCTGPVSFRETKQDCMVLGYRLLAGTPIMLMTQDVTHGRLECDDSAVASASRTKPSSVDEAERTDDLSLDQFHPKRWLTSTGEYDPQAVLSMPFSAGPRGCYGQRFAIIEIRIMLVALLWNFRFAKLDAGLSRYTSVDGLTRLPNCCHVLPILRPGRSIELQDERHGSSLPALG